MSTSKLTDAVSQLTKVLEPLQKDERQKVIQAVFSLLGNEPSGKLHLDGDNGGDQKERVMSGQEKTYFDKKDPKTKGEELAIAARFREQTAKAQTHTKEDIRKVVEAARRNFDVRNFKRDIENARTKGLFNRGTGKGQFTLSYYGQSYVDGLPDRNAVKKLRRPKSRRRNKKVAVRKP
jgi:hypothetical protein